MALSQTERLGELVTNLLDCPASRAAHSLADQQFGVDAFLHDAVGLVALGPDGARRRPGRAAHAPGRRRSGAAAAGGGLALDPDLVAVRAAEPVLDPERLSPLDGGRPLVDDDRPIVGVHRLHPAIVADAVQPVDPGELDPPVVHERRSPLAVDEEDAHGRTAAMSEQWRSPRRAAAATPRRSPSRPPPRAATTVGRRLGRRGRRAGAGSCRPEGASGALAEPGRRTDGGETRPPVGGISVASSARSNRSATAPEHRDAASTPKSSAKLHVHGHEAAVAPDHGSARAPPRTRPLAVSRTARDPVAGSMGSRGSSRRSAGHVVIDRASRATCRPSVFADVGHQR